MDKLLQGVLFVSSISGLTYRNHDAAGDISCVIVEGKRFYPMEARKLTNAMHLDGEGCAVLENVDYTLEYVELNVIKLTRR